jgi:hypothetical protein
MQLLHSPKTISTSVIQTPAMPSPKLTAKWVKIDSQLVCQWVVE